MRLRILSLTLAGVLASQAQAQPPPVSPQDFVDSAAGSNSYEVMAARIAMTESRDPAVRAFAERMITAHAAAMTALTAAAIRSGLKPPSASVGGDQSRLLASLQSQRRPKFDEVYARQQVLAHLQALVTERGYARAGSDADLRAAAAAAVPMIERHLREAESLQRSNSGG